MARGDIPDNGPIDGLFAADRQFMEDLTEQVGSWLNEDDASDPEFRFFIGQAPRLYGLLCRLSLEPDIEPDMRARLFWAMMYFVNDLDVIPERIEGPSGFVDDVIVAAMVVDEVAKGPGGESLVFRHWDGGEDIAQVIRRILDNAESLIGKPRWDLLRRLLREA